MVSAIDELAGGVVGGASVTSQQAAQVAIRLAASGTGLGSQLYNTDIGANVYFDGVNFVALDSSHDAVTLAGGVNPALALSSQELNLDLSASGSYDNAVSGLPADNIQGAIDDIVAMLEGNVVIVGEFDPNIGLPAGAINGQKFFASAAGTFAGFDFEVGDSITSTAASGATSGTADLTDWRTGRANDDQSAAQVDALAVGHSVAIGATVQEQLDQLDRAFEGYTQNFAAADWLPAGFDLEIAIPQATHLEGTAPKVVQVLTTAGERVDINYRIALGVGDVTLIIPASPPLAFAGTVQIGR